ncbi:MAG: hypothetical protein ABIH23_08705 [bacterium]
MPSRKHPVHGVRVINEQPTIVLVTVCTKNREPWLATHEIHSLLHSIWKEASAWLTGRYMIMPDHLHLFAAPGPQDIPLDNWIRFWKSQFMKQHNKPDRRWQTDHWDTRLRGSERYAEKWEYVCDNPVRHGLVAQAVDWPFQGEIYVSRW